MHKINGGAHPWWQQRAWVNSKSQQAALPPGPCSGPQHVSKLKSPDQQFNLPRWQIDVEEREICLNCFLKVF